MSNIPIYFTSIFRIPITVANRIERIQREFLWRDSEGKKKLHLMGWEKVTKNKKIGDLGVKRLLEDNSALLAKWWCRFCKENEALWIKVVSRRYGLGDEVWFPKVPTRGKASNIWKDICSLGNICADMGECLIQGFSFKVNSGNNIRFWKDKWSGDVTLKLAFPRIFNISTQKDAFILEMMDGQSKGSWNF